MIARQKRNLTFISESSLSHERRKGNEKDDIRIQAGKIS